jgi:hypothetical protein
MTATLLRLDRLTTKMRLNKVASKGSIAQTFGDGASHTRTNSCFLGYASTEAIISAPSNLWVHTLCIHSAPDSHYRKQASLVYGPTSVPNA